MRWHFSAILLILFGVMGMSATTLMIGGSTAASIPDKARLLDRLPSSAKPSIQFLRFEFANGETIAIFGLSNRTNRTIYFYGYEPKLPQLWFQRKSGREWKDAGWHWCGTGMELRELPPGTSIEFGVAASDIETWNFGQSLAKHRQQIRVGTNFGYDKRMIETRLWSEGVDLMRRRKL